MANHVVVGAGQVGTRLATVLNQSDHEVRLVSRTGNTVAGVTAVRADAGDRDALSRATAGAEVIYNCVNPPYRAWEREWPPIADNFITAAEAAGAVLVTLSNLYGYGIVAGPITERTPLNAHTRKGRVREAMWRQALAAHEAGRIRATEVRASDYIGEAGVQTNFGERVIPAMRAGKPIILMGRTDQPHTWTFTGDAARMLATAGTDERAWGRAWHVPSPAPRTQAQVVADLADVMDVAMPRIRAAGPWMLRAVGLFNPDARELVEMLYEFDRPFVMDSTLSQRTFGLEPTEWTQIITETLQRNVVTA